jgi:hypothetical protein
MLELKKRAGKEAIVELPGVLTYTTTAGAAGRN